MINGTGKWLWVWALCLLTPFCQAAPATESAAAPSSQLASVRTLSFKQMGAGSALRLRGGNAIATIGFGSRADELVTSLTLKLRYIYSPAMLTDLSHVQVIVNDQVVAVLPFAKDQGGRAQEASLTLDPRLLTSFNRIQFRLIGHYTLRCEDETNSSIWAEISNGSEIQMTTQALSMANDLVYFPEPFFYALDYSQLELPMVFAGQPSLGALQAAGELASWFGALSGWRGARFPAVLDGMPPPRHAIVFAANGQRPGFLKGLPPVSAPMIAVMSHPSRPEFKLLVLMGRDDQDLQQAARALVLGQAGMSGDMVRVGQVRLVAPRKPYDAPNWVRSDGPTRLGSLAARKEDLQVSGLQLAPIRVAFRVPGDLFTWGSRGIPLNLKFRYTGPQANNGSRLSIGVNDFFVQSLSLSANGIGGAQAGMRMPVLENGLLTSVDRVLLPPFRVGSRNELEFQYSFASEKQGECASGALDSFHGEVDPDSTMDFSKYPHYAQMPNLSLFATSGYPFTRLADLAETALVLPARPQTSDINVFLTVMGRMGASTGFPALRYRLVSEDDVDRVNNADLLVIGDSRELKLLRAWRDRLPALLEGDFRQVGNGGTAAKDDGAALLPGATLHQANGRADFSARGRVGALLGLESPLAPGRSAVIITASEADAMAGVASALIDDAALSQMSGSVVLMRGGTIDSQLLGPVYHVGSLPPWDWAWLLLSGHPLLLAMLAALAVLLLAFVILRILRILAARRLRES